jgi:hypothetical protein
VLDDEVDCTRDRCDEALDQVVHNPRDFECVDADECTVDRCDAVQGCVHEPNPACLQAPTSLPSGGHGARALLFLALALLGTVSLRAGSIDSARLRLAARALRALAMRAGGRSRRSSSGRGRRRRRSRD